MGQLESLRELNIAESKIKERRKEKYANVVHSNGKFSEAWDVETLNIEIIWKLHSFVLVHFTLFRTCDVLTCLL
jgi:hypothetical protein